MNINPIVGHNIKTLRKKFGFTQESFSEFLGINRVELSYYENGKRPVPISIISQAADIFGIDGYELYQKSQTENQSNLAFAFRADELGAQELREISSFKKIVKNYLQMKQLLKNE